MSNLLQTKPKHVNSIATNEGWVDAKTGEIYVAIKDLRSKLEREGVLVPKRKPGRPKKVKNND